MHAPSTGPDAKLYTKSPAASATLCHMGHVVIEDRSGLVAAAETTPAIGTAEREAAVSMVKDLAGRLRITQGTDKAYDTADLVAEPRHSATALVGWIFPLTAAARNLVRLPKPLAAAASSCQACVLWRDSRPAERQKSIKSVRRGIRGGVRPRNRIYPRRRPAAR